jgi:hypothetical protein
LSDKNFIFFDTEENKLLFYFNKIKAAKKILYKLILLMPVRGILIKNLRVFPSGSSVF